MAVIKEVVVGGTSRSGHGCVPCGGGAPKACAVRGAQGVFYWLGVCGIIAGLGVGAWMRDDYYEYRRGDKWYRTIVFRDFEVKCEDIDGGDGRPVTLRDWIDFFRDPDAFYNATVSAFFETFGSGDLDAAQFYANHCDADVLRKLANARKPGDGRDARCDFGTSDFRDASCAGGMFRWRRRDGGEGRVDAAPEGYFSPEFQTCLVRCATGAFCPRSARSSNASDTCRYPGGVAKSAAPFAVGENATLVCPGAAHLYLCPAGSYCRDSARRDRCEVNHACPTGATRGARCHGLFHGAKSSVPCGTQGLKFPSYDETCGLFMATVLALLTLVYAISAQRRRSPSGAKRGVAARLAASDDAAKASARRAFGLTGDDDFPPWYGLEFDGHARLAGLAGAAALVLLLVSLFFNGFAVAAVCFFAVAVFGGCGLCHYDLLVALAAADARNRALWVCCGCARRAHVAVVAVFALVSAVAAFVVFTSLATQWAIVVLAFAAFIAASSAAGAAALSVLAFRERRGGDDDDDDDDPGAFPMPSLRHARTPSLPSLRQVDQRVDVAFDRVGLAVRKTGKTVLADVSGAVTSGSVTAIMGPSGAGKTTLMSVLADRAGGYGVKSGDVAVYVDGRRHKSEGLSRLSSLVAFVPQDDVMLPELTVRQTLAFYAAIKAPRPLSTAEVDARVADVLDIVQLPRSTHDEVIGDAERRGVSGGQKKRVNVAMEIVTNPSLIFLDEPTSGLDSATSAHVVGALSELGRRGVNVVVVLHQPSFAVFASFTHVLLLGVGGRMVFHGAPAAAAPYFEDLGYEKPEFSNPADFYMEILSGLASPKTSASAARLLEHQASLETASGVAAALAETWGASASAAADRLEAPEGRRASIHVDLSRGRNWCAQCSLFARRALLQELMKPETLAFDVVLLTASGATFGSQSKNVEVASLPYMIVWVGIGLQLFLAVTSLRVFGGERLVHWREAAPGSGMALSASAYFFGKDLVQLPRLAILTLSFTVPFYTLATPDPTLPFVFLCFYLLSYAVSGYAYAASVVAGPKDAQLLVVCISLVLVMLSPPSERLETTNADVFPRLLTWLSPIRWAGETLIVAMTRDLSYAWKMPPFFYAKPHRESALAVVITPTFHEGWLYDVEVREFDDGVCRVRGKWIKNEVLNLPVLLGLGVASRLAALALLNWANESHFGRAPLLERLAARMRRGRRPAEAPPRTTSLVDGGDAARPDVDEEGPSFEEQRSRAPSKDALPELRSVEEARFIALERFESGL